MDVEVAEAADTRREGRRHAYLRTTKGRLLGRPVEGKRLLSGFLVCECGSTFEAVRGVYVCSARRRKGPDVCPSEVAMPVEEIERTFLDCVEGSCCTPTSLIASWTPRSPARPRRT